MEKYLKYRKYWQQQWVKEDIMKRKRMNQLLNVASAAAKILYSKYKVKEVYLLGSLRDEEKFHIHSDIDLAVKGLSSSSYFTALAELWHLLPAENELDLIPIEDVSSAMRKEIKKKGLLIENEQKVFNFTKSG